MKRSEMLKIIKKICVDWENCKVEKRMAEEILTEVDSYMVPREGVEMEEYDDSIYIYDQDGNALMWEDE